MLLIEWLEEDFFTALHFVIVFSVCPLFLFSCCVWLFTIVYVKYWKEKKIPIKFFIQGAYLQPSKECLMMVNALKYLEYVMYLTP